MSMLFYDSLIHFLILEGNTQNKVSNKDKGLI